METITVLSLDVVRKLLARTGTSSDGTLDLTPPRFALKAHFQEDVRMSALSGLRHVTSCENDKEYFTRKVKRVILSGNELCSRGDVGGNLLELRVFRRSLEVVLAENCHLDSLGWPAEKKFPNLVELNLARNFIQEIPDLAACPKLRILNLANNEISTLALLGTNTSLMNVDLSGNKIDYETVSDMKRDFLQGLGPLSALLVLKLEKNPVTFRNEFRERYRDVVMHSIPKCRLTYLDGPVNEEIIQRAKKVESRPEVAAALVSPRTTTAPAAVSLKPSRTLSAAAAAAAPVPSLLAVDLTFPCTLSDLDAMLDSCLSSASEASAVMDKLQIEASRVVAAGGGGLFLQEERAGGRAAQLTQDFLQKTISLSERRPELCKRILILLTTLCRVEEDHEFGSACFRQLRVFMGANEETKALVISVVGENLSFQSINDLRLVGELTEMAEKMECAELLSRGNGPASALPFVVAQLRNPMLHTASKQRERDICFHFMAIASQDERARLRFGQENVGDLLAPEFERVPNANNASAMMVREWVLQTIKNLSAGGVRNGRKSTNLFFADYVVTPPLRLHRNLLRELDAQRDTDEMMALQIDVLVVLLERSRIAFTDLCASGSNALYQVLARHFLPKASKHLLTEAATYRAVSSLFTTCTSNWCPLVTQTCTRTRKDILEEVQRLVFHGEDVCTILDTLKQDALAYREAWSAAKYEEDIPVPAFKDLQDEKMHVLFVALIDLVRAFNTAAQSGLVMAKTISERMNTRGRETRLFACLEIPSDSVRLAAVRCLDTVKLSQFDSNEINFLLKLLKEVRDVSAGKTEEVLSVSLGILTKLSKQGGREFERKFAKTSVDVCLKLLEMNVNRETRGMEREAEEKRLLTASCIKLLLQATSRGNALTQQHVLSDAVSSKISRILAVEDGLFDRKLALKHDPVLVELISTSVANLTSVFVGVNPSGPVAARVLRRMANVLTFNRDGLILETEQSWERNPVATQFVGFDVQREREMDSESWSVLFHALKSANNNGKGEGEENEGEALRMKQHEAFLATDCLNQILQTLSRSAAMQQQQAQQQQEKVGAVLNPPFSPINPRLCHQHANATLHQLLERHLMCERERENNLDTGGDLRSLQIHLSPQEMAEAQRDLSRLDEDAQVMDKAEYFETLGAAMRVFYAALRFGTPASRHAAQQTLRERGNFQLLLQLFFGSRDNPQYARNLLGAKFFFLVEAVLDLPSTRREELGGGEKLKELDALVFACADRAMGLLRKRLQCQSRLAVGDEFLVKACMSACASVAHQFEYWGEEGEEGASPEEVFCELVPSTLLSSALQVLLFDMSPKRNNTPMTSATAAASKPLRRNMFGENVEDGARERTISFLSYCLRHSPPHRYSILEFLIRSNLTDPFPVRRILIQELMKRTHKIGSTQRVALEYLVSEQARTGEGGREGEEEGIIPSNRDALTAPVLSTTGAKGQEPSPSSSWFAWCNGTARKQQPSPSQPLQLDSGALAGLNKRKRMPSEDEAPALREYALLWNKFTAPAPGVPGDWTSDRLGPRERVVAHSFVLHCTDKINLSALDRSKAWFYHACLVLTSESYYLFQVDSPNDFDFPRRWTLTWKRPYRAVDRIALGSCRVHLLHRDSDDDETTQHQHTLSTFYTPSRSSAKELATAFYELNRAWHALLFLQPPPAATTAVAPQPPQPVMRIENAQNERFRVANMLGMPGDNATANTIPTSLGGMMFCDLVRFCVGEKSEKWRLGVALIQHDMLLFLDKQEWVLEDASSLPVEVLASFEMAPKTQILKPLLRVVDFSLGAEPPSPALVLEFGTASEKRSVAIAFLDDLSRTVWRKFLTERFFKTL